MPLSGKMFIKEHGTEFEAELQRVASKYGFCPRILGTEITEHGTRIIMEDVEELSLADVYGTNPKDIPEWIWTEIREMLDVLFYEEGIEYVDITPYNFIEKDDRIYMIDFGDAKYTAGEPDWFLLEFLDGENSWNPDYK